MARNRTKTAQKSLVDVKTWFRDDYVKKDGQAAISLMIYLKGKRVVFKTGVAVAPEFWDYAKQIVKGADNQAKELNLIISNCKARINDIFVKYRLQHKELTPELLKKEYEIQTSYVDYYGWMRRTIQERKGELAEKTIAHHRVTLNKLQEFKKELTFAEIDERFITKFKLFLQKQKKNDAGTVHNALKFFRSYLSIAVKEGIIEKNPFSEIKLKRPEAEERTYLNPLEVDRLIALYKKETLSDNLQKTLRHYLFSCFTGLRISDLRGFTVDMILNDMLVYVPQKTKNKKPEFVRVPLTNPAKALIQDESPHRLRGNVFRMFADQTINRQLPKIFKEAEIDKEGSFHSSRHTFATIFLRKTKNILALQKLLGHSDIKQTMIYAHLISEDLVEEMKIFEEFRL